MASGICIAFQLVQGENCQLPNDLPPDSVIKYPQDNMDICCVSSLRTEKYTAVKKVVVNTISEHIEESLVCYKKCYVDRIIFSRIAWLINKETKVGRDVAISSSNEKGEFF